MVWLRNLSFTLVASLVCQSATAATVLLEFTTQNCGPCRRMRPVMQRLAAEGFAAQEVDASQQPQAADQFRVTQFPTFLVLVDGQEHARLVGGTTYAQLVEMIHRATAIAAQQRQLSSNAGGVAFVDSGAEPASSFANVAHPVPGRVTQLSSQQASPAGASAAVSNPFRNASSSAPVAPTSPGLNAANPVASPPAGGAATLIDATVRLSIVDPAGKSTGTGTIIDSRQGKALILTCGHLFRDSQGKGTIEVTLFRAGAQGAEPTGTVEAQLIDYDLDRDLALVCFQTTGVAFAPLAPRGTALAINTPATSVGCGHGANPTPWETHITAVNRYQGHPNVEAARAPEEGRSGGGLFNPAGQLIGVCYAADHQGNEGLYASLDSIYQKLDALQLSATLATPPPSMQQSQPPAAAAPQLAGSPSGFEVRGQSPSAPPTSLGSDASNPFSASPPLQEATAPAPAPVQPTQAATTADVARLPAEERAAIQEIGRRAANSEVIVIIRPHDAATPSEVIKLKTASPEFVRTLEAASRPGSSADFVAAEPGATVAR
jgi:thiol-disulfide isomerase/thioredoxin